jgi:2-oxoglutarate ferredoxin oxidoreductase subunit alpha
MQARWGTHGDHTLIALCPSGVQETHELTVRAFNLSERYRVPVILLLDEVIGHITERFQRPEPGTLTIVDRTTPAANPESYLPYDSRLGDVPPIAPFGEGYRFHVTGLAHDESGFPTNVRPKVRALLERLERKIMAEYATFKEAEQIGVDDAEILIFAFGSVARSARRAMRTARERSLSVGLYRPVVIWPFPYDDVKELGGRVKRIVVPEMNMGQLVHEVRCAAGSTEVVPVNRFDGDMLNPDDILEALES